MQKAVIVRATLEDGREVCRSYDVDPVPGAPSHPLRRLLAAGWNVVQICPMTNDVDNACLVVLDREPAGGRPAGKQDLSLVEMDHPGPRASHSANKSKQASNKWDGQTIPLGIFRIDPAHVDETTEKRPS
jgi:hypothetical protein